MTLPPITLAENFSPIAGDYDVVFSDVWGVIHNGVKKNAEACDALAKFRAKGGHVVLITNAPRQNEVVRKQLAKLDIYEDVYDGIASSGDVTRAAIADRPGQSVFHIGPERDVSIFEGFGLTFKPIEQADYVVCTGLFNDDVETLDDYRATLEGMLARRQFMVCGNPDIVVDRGDTLVYCAGALAEFYANMGGEVTWAGKPYRPIYELARARAVAAGAKAQGMRGIAIGDSVRTDIKGAHAFGLDCLFITSGIHAEELGGRHNPDLKILHDMFTAAGEIPRAVMRVLAW